MSGISINALKNLISFNSFKNLQKMKTLYPNSSSDFARMSSDMVGYPSFIQSRESSSGRIPEANPQLKTVLHGVTTGTPEYSASQREMFELLIKKPSIKEKIGAERLNNLMTKTMIDKRYFAFNPLDYVNKTLSYGEKKKIINEVGGNLAISVARQALIKSKVKVEDIGQIIFVSSTDFATPGLDILLMDELNIPKNANRIPILFEGCGVGLRGLAAAKHFCMENPGKSSLVVCCELNSMILNYPERSGMDQMVKYAIFGDGCAAAVLSAQELQPGDGKWIVEDYNSCLVEDSRKMVQIFWSDEANGHLDAIISRNLPDLVSEGIHPFIDGCLKKKNLNIEDVAEWAIHPGGAKILRNVQSGLKLSDEQMSKSWNGLQNYGNMSSASVWFVIENILKQEKNISGDHLLALGVGPGISMEEVLLKKY